jgi:hypothetical protein
MRERIMSTSSEPDEVSKYAPRWVREGIAKLNEVAVEPNDAPRVPPAIGQDESPWRDADRFENESEQALNLEPPAEHPFFVPEYVDRGPIRSPLQTIGEVSFGVIAVVALALFLDDRLTSEIGAAFEQARTSDAAPIAETAAILAPTVTNVAYVVVSPAAAAPPPMQSDQAPVEQQQVQQAQPAQPIQAVQQVQSVQQVQQAQELVQAPQVQPVQSVRVQRSPEEVDQLIRRAETFFAQGDVATARLFLERAAEARDSRATLMLGRTYDPDVLSRMGVVGIRPNLEQAQMWYTRAAEFGSREASQRLAALSRLIR